MADIFNSTFLTTKGLGQLGMANKAAAAKEALDKARVLTVIQAQKMRKLIRPIHYT